MKAPETRYVMSGSASIAYQAVGEGPPELILVMGIPHSMDAFWDIEPGHRFLDRLASFSRLVLFDRRGVGLSDPVMAAEAPTLEQWMGDALAVLDEVGSERAVVLGCDVIGSQVAALLAATHPTRFAGLLIVNG